VAEHQANHARILHLRQTADALDAQIKSSIALLAETRNELLSTAARDSPTARHVPFDELLAYAKRISRFTLPPNYRPPPKQPEDTPKPSIETEDVVMSNGGAEAASPPVAAAETEANTQEPGLEPEGAAYAALTDAQKDWLDQMAKAPFIPWPNEEDMKLGALAAVQQMIRDGRDPWTVLAPEEQAELDVRQQLEEEEKKKQQAEELTRLRRGSFGRAGPARPAEKKESTFTGFELYNPDDEEGEE
jgi:hypothetical protein